MTKLELQQQYPYLQVGSGPVIAAANIRAQLKRAFPAVKFSVKTKRFSGGNDITVNWTDGPTSKQVEAITDNYEMGSFDGMDDSYKYCRTAWNETFGSTKYLFCNREFSDKLITSAIVKIASEYGIKDIPEVEEYNQGNAIGSPMSNHDGRHGHWCWQSLINRTAGELEVQA